MYFVTPRLVSPTIKTLDSDRLYYKITKLLFFCLLHDFILLPDTEREREKMASLLARKPIKWARIATKAIAKEERKKEAEVRNQKVFRSYEYQDLDSFKEMNSSGMLRLESLERALRYLFEHSDLKLGAMQERLVNEIKIAFLKKMFGDDLVANLKFLCEKFSITELFDTMAVLVPSACFTDLSQSLSYHT